MLINVKMPTIVGILTFMSRINFVLSWVEHEKSFITMGPCHYFHTIMALGKVTFHWLESGFMQLQAADCMSLTLSFHCIFISALKRG